MKIDGMDDYLHYLGFEEDSTANELICNDIMYIHSNIYEEF